MSKSFEDDRMTVFANLSQNRRQEIAQTVKGYIDDLLDKVDPFKKAIIEKTKKAIVGKKGKAKGAKDQMRQIDDLVDTVLVRAYPLLSQGLGLTNPLKTVTCNPTKLNGFGLNCFFCFTGQPTVR